MLRILQRESGRLVQVLTNMIYFGNHISRQQQFHAFVKITGISLRLYELDIQLVKHVILQNKKTFHTHVVLLI